mmetsp:Transcript_9657/g.27544  ORF Transcript_9657/g.27544 Transcript_9657/m.27544 type:complete len:284 (+) Transcript_9657:1917-2768(+)
MRSIHLLAHAEESPTLKLCYHCILRGARHLEDLCLGVCWRCCLPHLLEVWILQTPLLGQDRTKRNGVAKVQNTQLAALDRNLEGTTSRSRVRALHVYVYWEFCGTRTTRLECRNLECTPRKQAERVLVELNHEAIQDSCCCVPERQVVDNLPTGPFKLSADLQALPLVSRQDDRQLGLLDRHGRDGSTQRVKTKWIEPTGRLRGRSLCGRGRRCTTADIKGQEVSHQVRRTSTWGRGISGRRWSRDVQAIQATKQIWHIHWGALLGNHVTSSAILNDICLRVE